MVFFRVIEQCLIIALLPLAGEVGGCSDLLGCAARFTLTGIF